MAKSKTSKTKIQSVTEPKDAPKIRSEVISIFDKFSVWQGFGLLWGCVLLISVILFKDYLFHKKYFLFLDLGADSINIIYTNLMHYADYIKSEGMPAWSFKAGMGQNINPFWLDPIATSVLFLFGKENIAGSLVLVVVIEIFLAATFFYAFLQSLQLHKFASTVGALSYAFCGYLIVCSTWDLNKYPTEVYQAAFLLFALEQWIGKSKWYFFPLSIALIAIHQPFYLYLYGVLILIYTLVRHFEDASKPISQLLLQLLGLVGFGILGLALAGFILPSNIYQIIESPRVAGGVSYFDTLSAASPFDMSDGVQTASAFLRFFSNDLLGTGSDYRGWQNYMEAPVLYAGILTLVAAPQAFALATRRQVIIYGAIAFACFLILTFPYFRYAFWLFSGDYYRTAGFFIVIFLLFLAYRGISQIVQKSEINLVVLVATLVVLLFVLYAPYEIPKENINSRLRTLVSFFVVLQAGILYLLSRSSLKNMAQIGALVLVIAEILFLDNPALNRRNAASVSEYKDKSSLFEDATNEAVARLKKSDTSFYRIDKDYASSPAIFAGLNDAKLQDYYGTSCYSSFNQVNYVRFLLGMGLVKKGDEFSTRWVNGLGGNTLLESVNAVKYVLIKNPNMDLRPQGFTPVDTVGEVKVLKNNNALPLAFTYNQYADEKTFEQLSPFARQKVLLHACVLSQEKGKELGLSLYQQADTTSTLNGVEYNDAIVARKANPFTMTQFSDNHIEGNIKLQTSQLLYWSIPFDIGWKAKVDGKEQKIEQVSFGFMGIPLSAGNHQISLQYEAPYVSMGTKVALVAWLLYIAGVIFFLIKQRKLI